MTKTPQTTRGGKSINLSVWLTHLSSIHICRVSLEEVWATRSAPERLLLSLPLSELFPSPPCPLFVLWRRGHSGPEGKLTQFLLLMGRSSSFNTAKAITQTFFLRLGIGHSHFRTETISRFSFFLFSHSPPRLLCNGRQVVFRSFSKGGKSFLAMHKRERHG